MVLKELALSQEALAEIQKTIIARMTNMGIVVRGGASVSDCLMAELVVIEVKLDAFMDMLEKKGHDFTNFNDHIIQAAKGGQATAVNIRQQMSMRDKGHNAPPPPSGKPHG